MIHTHQHHTPHTHTPARCILLRFLIREHIMEPGEQAALVFFFTSVTCSIRCVCVRERETVSEWGSTYIQFVRIPVFLLPLCVLTLLLLHIRRRLSAVHRQPSCQPTYVSSYYCYTHMHTNTKTIGSQWGRAGRERARARERASSDTSTESARQAGREGGREGGSESESERRHIDRVSDKGRRAGGGTRERR